MNKKTTILLIDDEQRIRQTFARNLRLAGCRVITAENGASGLELYDREQPDLVLLDMRLPDMDGLAVLQALREHDAEANVILMTGHGDKDAVIAALRAGASDFLPKPIDQVALESAIRRAEERIHLVRELRASQEALQQHNAQLEQKIDRRTADLEREIEEHKQTTKALRESQMQFKTLYNAMIEGICLHELVYDSAGHAIDYRIIDANPSYETILKLKRSAVVNKMASAIYGVAPPPYLSVYARVVQTGTPIKFETYYPPMRKSFLISAVSLGDDQFATTFEDITERKEAEKQLRFQAHLLDVVEQAVIVTNVAGSIVYWNPFAEQLYGWTAEEALGKTTIELIASGQSLQDAAEIMAHLQAGESWSGEYLAQRRNGTTLLIHSTITSICDEHGKPTHLIGLSNDITELKHVEHALRERIKELTCLHAVSQDAQRDMQLDQLCHRIIEHLIPAMQFPEIAVPVIELAGQRFTTEAYHEELTHSLHTGISANGELVGQLRIFYQEAQDFLNPEEQNLINSVAEMLGRWFERHHACDKG